MAAVLLNALAMGIEVDHSHEFPEVFEALSHIFCAIFTVEMIVKITVERCSYFKSGWNLLDFVLVNIALVDVWLLKLFFPEQAGAMKNLAILRLLRLCRLARMVKFLRLFKELWLIVSGVAASLKTIVWVSILLLIVLYIAGIFFTLTLGQNREDFDYQDRVPIPGQRVTECATTTRSVFLACLQTSGAGGRSAILAPPS